MGGRFFARFVKENLNLCFPKAGQEVDGSAYLLWTIAPAKIAK